MSDNIKYYQTIPSLGIKGRMNTPEEFDKIGLPKDLKGKRVLDIGCNMGAFLLECQKRGASDLCGIEPDIDWRLLARGVLFDLAQHHEVFLLKDIKDLYLEDFNLVLLLSITHLVDDPQKLIDRAYQATGKGGLLIIEVNDRLQEKKINLPEGAVEYGKNKDNRTVWHIRK